jgi:hypothetical protein
MSRLALFALLLGACSSAPRPIKNTNDTPTLYTLEPVKLLPAEGRHSARHTWTTISGSLEMNATQATLRLDVKTDSSFVHCPADWDTRSSLQACARPEDKDTSRIETIALLGESRSENGKLVISVRADDRAATLTCDASGKKLACLVEDEYTLFGRVGQRPETITFHL